MFVLGVNDGHDSGVTLIKSGEMLYASNEERFNRIKMADGFPKLALKDMLNYTNIGPKEINYIAIGNITRPQIKSKKEWRDYTKIRMRKIYTHVSRLNGKFLESKIAIHLHQLLGKAIRGKGALIKTLGEYGIKAPVKFVDHQLCHAASAYYTSGFSKALVFSLDGGGDGYSGAVFIGDGGALKKIGYTPKIHSAGIFWSYITSICGFNPRTHGGKITGLAAYERCDEAYDKLKNYFGYSKKNIGFFWKEKLFSDYAIFFLKELLKGYSKKQIANAAQRVLEENVSGIVQEACSKYKISQIALAGGVFANVKLNQRILELKEVEEIFVHPNMGDGGKATGAAYAIWAELDKKPKVNFPVKLQDVYLGPSYGEEDIEAELRKNGLNYRYIGSEITQKIAQLICDGKIVARFTGRMEYGPRALGNRSILCSATDPEINATINKKLNRTEFMPFAPVVLTEKANAYFENYMKGQNTSRFMTTTFQCSNSMTIEAPAVVHLDGTARPQSVSKQDNPDLYSILKHYFILTGIPIIINTSFNMHEEPIVNMPSEAIQAFLQAQLDVLAIGPFIVEA